MGDTLRWPLNQWVNLFRRIYSQMLAQVSYQNYFAVSTAINEENKADHSRYGGKALSFIFGIDLEIILCH